MRPQGKDEGGVEGMGGAEQVPTFTALLAPSIPMPK
jgi:hypothetical protein